MTFKNKNLLIKYCRFKENITRNPSSLISLQSIVKSRENLPCTQKMVFTPSKSVRKLLMTQKNQSIYADICTHYPSNHEMFSRSHDCWHSMWLMSQAAPNPVLRKVRRHMILVLYYATFHWSIFCKVFQTVYKFSKMQNYTTVEHFDWSTNLIYFAERKKSKETGAGCKMNRKPHGPYS